MKIAFVTTDGYFKELGGFMKKQKTCAHNLSFMLLI